MDATQTAAEETQVFGEDTTVPAVKKAVSTTKPKTKRVNVSEEVAKARLEKAKKVAKEKEEKLPQIKLPQQYHPCSWCGGFKKSLVPPKPSKKAPDRDKLMKEWEKTVLELKDEAVTGFEVPLEGDKQNMIACIRCVFKVFNAGLGQARFYKQEMDHLTGAIPNTGYFPARK